MTKFLVYSDIHHDVYSNGLTLDDTIGVEDQITKFAKDSNIKDVVFLGDWYRATNPLQQVIKAAEAAWKRRSDLGVRTYVLVGNHDRETKSANSRHAFAAADIFEQDLSRVCVVDKLNTIPIPDYEEDTLLVFIPTGHHTQIDDNFVAKVNEERKRRKVIVLFHDLMSGCRVPSGMINSGLNPKIFDKFKPDLILGGDNHTHQLLEHLTGYASMYLGAALQHNWGDRDQNRGFWCVNIGENITFEFIPSNTPKFIKIVVDANTESQAIMNVLSKIPQNESNILDITLLGATKEIQAYVEKNVASCSNRPIRVSINKEPQKSKIDMSNLTTSEDKWRAYVESDTTNSAGLDAKLLVEMGGQMLLRAKQEI